MMVGSSGALPANSSKTVVTATQSSARPTDKTVASKGRNTAEDHSYASTSSFSRNNDMAVGPSSSANSDNSQARNLKSNRNSIGGSSSLNVAESESLASGVATISLNGKSEFSKPAIPKKPLSQYKPEKWMLPDKEDDLAQLNLAIVSFLMPNLILLL